MLPECLAELISRCDDEKMTLTELLSVLRNGNEIIKKNIMIILNDVIWNQIYTMETIKRLMVGCKANQKVMKEQVISTFADSKARMTATKKINSKFKIFNDVMENEKRVHNTQLISSENNALLKNDNTYDKLSPDIHRSIQEYLYKLYPSIPYFGNEHDEFFKNHIKDQEEENLQLIDDSLRAFFYESEILLPKKAFVTLIEAYWVAIISDLALSIKELNSYRDNEKLYKYIHNETESKKESYRQLLLSYIVDAIHTYLENRNFNMEKADRDLLEVDKYHFLILPSVELMLQKKPVNVKMTFDANRDDKVRIWNKVNSYLEKEKIDLKFIKNQLLTYYKSENSWGIIKRKDKTSLNERNNIRRYWRSRAKEITKIEKDILKFHEIEMYEAYEIYLFAFYIDELINIIQDKILDYYVSIKKND